MMDNAVGATQSEHTCSTWTPKSLFGLSQFWLALKSTIPGVTLAGHRGPSRCSRGLDSSQDRSVLTPSL